MPQIAHLFVTAVLRRGGPALAAACLVLGLSPLAHAAVSAGTARVDVTPPAFPVLVNGGMFTNSAKEAKTPLYARAIVLDDGRERIAVVIVDSCMLPRQLLDEAKQLAAPKAGIRPERMLIAATHTHTAPAAMGCLGTDADPAYVPFLRQRLAEAIIAAAGRLEPARVGFGVGNAAEFTAVRRWIIRPDRMIDDPFGNPTVRANMHAGAKLENVTGESGPEDPDLGLLSIQARDGRPLAVLANFSMHYFAGVPALNYDYFGLFCEGLEQRLAAGAPDKAACMVAMSHGCSGDIWRRDYTSPALAAQAQQITITRFTEGLLDEAMKVLRDIDHRNDVDLDMAEARMSLRYRVPDRQRLLWARQVVEAMGDRPPKTTEEVYAREAVILHERQSTEIVVQAVRIGDIAIATTPNETYALTGMKIKLQSPLPRTMVIELANGGDGYIPPPEQHLLGGYTTWPARSAGLEVQAEPKITARALDLLEQVSGRPRRTYRQGRGAAAEATLALGPAAYWRLDDFAGPRAVDSGPLRQDAVYEPGVVFFLAGPRPDRFCLADETNRAAHFAGGRLDARVHDVGDEYSVSLWCWNGLPADARETAGWLFSRGPSHGLHDTSEHLGVGGTATAPGRLVYLQGDGGAAAKTVVGTATLDRWTWYHVAFIRERGRVRVHLNGSATPDIDVPTGAGASGRWEQFFFGGRTDGTANWEGRLDEVAVFPRALTPAEIARLAAP